jgi:outer membrane protein TolC
MNEIIKTVLCVTFLSSLLMRIAPCARAEDTTNQIKSLTLQECIARGLENNLETKSERINPTIGTWGVVGAQGVYDPTLAGSINYQDSTTHQLVTGTNGLPALEEQQLQPNLSLAGKLPTGATYDLSAIDARSSGNTVSNFLHAGSAAISVTQPVLKNFGLGVNSALIRVARANRSVAIQNFVQFVMSKISEVSNAYYELVYAIENHKAALETRELARQLLDENRQREKIGTMSRLDVIQAESGVASSEQAVILTGRAIKDNENTLKRLICQQVSEFRGVSLDPVDYPVVHMIATDVAQSTRTALQMRADYLSAKHALDRQNIVVQFNRNQLWPEIDLLGSYGFNGRSRGDFGDFIDNTASGHYPVWSAGVAVTVPIGNRQARANYHTARLQAEQQLLSLKELEQDIIVQVDNAVGHVETNLKSVEAAQAAYRLAQESLDAEKKKLLAGTSTTFLVLQAQSQLAAARSAEIRARADYSESLVALDLAEGTVLQKHNIELDEKF